MRWALEKYVMKKLFALCTFAFALSIAFIPSPSRADVAITPIATSSNASSAPAVSVVDRIKNPTQGRDLSSRQQLAQGWGSVCRNGPYYCVGVGAGPIGYPCCGCGGCGWWSSW